MQPLPMNVALMYTKTLPHHPSAMLPLMQILCCYNDLLSAHFSGKCTSVGVLHAVFMLRVYSKDITMHT